MDFLLKYKKAYLMVGGTFLPGIGGYLIVKSMGGNQASQNLAALAGLILGGMITARMLK